MNIILSTSTFKFVQLLQDNICAAMEASDSSEMEMCRLFTTARNMIEIFISLAPIYHQQALTTVPQIAGLLFYIYLNNFCFYLKINFINIF